MTRTRHLLTCWILVLALIAAPAALAHPAEEGTSPWWPLLTDTWGSLVAALSGGDDGNAGPYIDPNG